jgi:hypothetical protein
LREIYFLLIAFALAGVAGAENWDRFRGPNGTGETEAGGIPTEWTEADYLW